MGTRFGQLTGLVVVALLVLAAPSSSRGAADANRPNLILILVDDFGYECVGANGSASYKTPNLDALAAAGVRFEHCYVTPLCTPTRVQLMTGQYNVRNYTTFGEMDPRCTTFANVLKNAGYATCMTGKWQLGRAPERPKQFGFDEYCLWQHTRRPDRYKNPGLEINGREHDYNNGEYGPDLVNDYALDFISRTTAKKSGPFFLYYTMMLTHGPFDATPDSADYDDEANRAGGKGGGKGQGKKAGKKGGKKAGRGDLDQQHFADMVQYMDKLVGKLVKKLDETGQRENTLILLVGDNGTGKGIVSKMKDGRTVMGAKGESTIGGMHVPLIASWPGRIQSGKVNENIVDSTDFLPTLCQAAGVKLPADYKVDGKSFLPQLVGEPNATEGARQWYYSWYAPRGKLVADFAATKQYKLHRDGRMYDVTKDPQEKNPLNASAVASNPEAKSAAELLKGALAQYKNARPPGLPLKESAGDAAE